VKAGPRHREVYPTLRTCLRTNYARHDRVHTFIHFADAAIYLGLCRAGVGHLTPRNESELSKTYFALFPEGVPIALDSVAADDE
jgi:hypothetical protein